MSTRPRESRPRAPQRVTAAPSKQRLPSGPELWLRQYWYVAVGVVLALGLVAWVVVESTRPDPGRAVPIEPGSHVAEGSQLTTANRPPSSGMHYPTIQAYGVYEDEVPAGRWIHTLEHGAVAILYNCSGGARGCPELVEQIKQFYSSAPRSKYNSVKILATPFSQMDHKIAVVAWGRIDEFDAWDADRVSRFYKRFVDRGPEDVP
ncbi:MAG: DUF3105 domain-containing protein [Chloroflexi bacterium]|nr:DUF3105 domain-containing protein [Chloroflexota bacterium]